MPRPGNDQKFNNPWIRDFAFPRIGGYRDLGVTPFARRLELTDDQTYGHWCSRCEGIWFGFTLEAECPVCGNRKG